MHRTVSPSRTCFQWSAIASGALVSYGIVQNLFAEDGFEFQGDAALLQIVRDAQETNSRAFPRGQMAVTAQLDIVSGDGTVKQREVRTSLVWDGQNTFWDYDLVERHANEPNRARGRDKVRMIHTARERIWHSREQERVQIDFKPHMAVDELLQLRPDQLWYCTAERADRSWQKRWFEYLDPEKYRNGRLVMSVERGEGDQIIVKRHYVLEIAGKQFDTTVTIVGSLSFGGNVVEFYQTPMMGVPAGVDGYGTRGVYEWTPLGDGRFYLKSMRFREFVSRPEDPIVTFDVDVESFDPNPTIKPNQFTLAALEIEPGTIVEERGGQGRTYRFGKEPVLLKEEELDKLADEQRARGFANPKREVRP